MRAKPGRPRKSAPNPPKPRAPKPRLPAGLTPGQRKHLRDLLAAVDPGPLFGEYVQTLRMRDKAQAELDAGDLVISTERHGRKTSPAWRIYSSCCDRLLRIRDMMTRAQETARAEPPAPQGVDPDLYERNVQRILAGEVGMDLLIDNADGDHPWQDDPRVRAYCNRKPQ